MMVEILAARLIIVALLGLCCLATLTGVIVLIVVLIQRTARGPANGDRDDNPPEE